MGVRSMVRTETKVAPRIAVTQRLKRMPRLLQKLHRMRDSNLARLEDVGGCRAVLRDMHELERVRRRLKRRWGEDIVRERDYIANPKDIGYRAVHLVVRRDERRIEVQLRTDLQQIWADAVEAADSRLKLRLKDGEGPAEMLAFFQAAGAVQYALDQGRVPSEDEEGALAEAREAVIRAGYYSR